MALLFCTYLTNCIPFFVLPTVVAKETHWFWPPSGILSIPRYPIMDTYDIAVLHFSVSQIVYRDHGQVSPLLVWVDP